MDLGEKEGATPGCGYVRNYLETSAALLIGLEKTQEQIIPVKSQSKFLILSPACSALQALAFHLGIQGKWDSQSDKKITAGIRGFEVVYGR